jgi:hypothetical protein
MARLGLVGVAGIGAPPAVAQILVGLDRHSVRGVLAQRYLRLAGAAELAERERALIEALLRLGIDHQHRVGGGERPTRVAVQAARARQQPERAAIVGQPPRETLRERQRRAEAVRVGESARRLPQRRRMLGRA